MRLIYYAIPFFLATIGIERWLATTGREQDMQVYRERKDLHRELMDLVNSAREDLRAYYARDVDAAEKRHLKAMRLERLSADVSGVLGGRQKPQRFQSRRANLAVGDGDDGGCPQRGQRRVRLETGPVLIDGVGRSGESGGRPGRIDRFERRRHGALVAVPAGPRRVRRQAPDRR